MNNLAIAMVFVLIPSIIFGIVFIYFDKKSMIAVICTDGQLNIENIQFECIKGKWAPLLVLKDKNTEEINIPVFNLEDICFRFIVRNLPKDWKRGCVHLSDYDIAAIIKKGWKFMPLEFPRKYSESETYEIGFEIHEFSEEPDFRAR